MDPIAAQLIVKLALAAMFDRKDDAFERLFATSNPFSQATIIREALNLTLADTGVLYAALKTVR